MSFIKPKKLELGNTIGIIATSGALLGDPKRLQLAKNYFETLGYKIKISEKIFSQNRYLAGDDTVRVEELHKFFLDEEVDAIICLRGGYGTIRLLEKIDYSIINNNPKIFCGFSDVTVLNAIFLKNSDLITYSAPMILSDFASEKVDNATAENFFKAVNGEKLEFDIREKYNSCDVKALFWGGNLSSLTSLCGIDFVPDEEFIFFTEDLNEPVYKIDKMFRQLLNISKFRANLKAIVLGDFLSLDNELWFDELIKEFSDELKVPIVKAEGITHSSPKITLPYGEIARISDNKLIFERV
ncbi:MAG: LD-carboxypeptidase [Candidatus Gastranaerophilales bacterium]